MSADPPAVSAADPPAIWERYPSHQRIAINVTLKCNLTCAHCNVDAGPQRTERLPFAAMRDLLERGVPIGKRHVTFSGGEVFMRYGELVELVRLAAELGYAVDVETNAYWARDEAAARRKLDPLVEAGLAGLALSADAYHLEFFPIERSVVAARVARAMGLLVELNYCPSPDPAADARVLAVLEASGEPFISNELLDIGRARDLVMLTPRHALDELPTCDALTMTVHATGDMFACCELEGDNRRLKRTAVFLGNLESDTVEEAAARQDVVRAFYDEASPAYFRRLVATDPAFAGLGDGRYRNICDFCSAALGDRRRVDIVRRLATGDNQ